MAKKFFLPVLLLALSAGMLLAQPTRPHQRTEDVIYGRKHGLALTMDVWKPENANGLGIVFIMSGGWYSSKESHGAVPFKQWYPALVDAGFTVFTVVHGSQPKFIIPEIVPDIQRAIRYIKTRASDFGVDPNRLGLMGGSAGGHLTLMIITQPAEGNLSSPDPVERQNTKIKAAAAFFPPTDFLNYSRPGEDAVGVGTLAGFKAPFGPRSETPVQRQVYGKEISPITYLTREIPPTLLIHGDADKLVPYYQSEIFEKKAKELGAQVKLVRREGLAHGWPDYSPDMKLAVEWFQDHLKK